MDTADERVMALEREIALEKIGRARQPRIDRVVEGFEKMLPLAGSRLP